MAKEKALEMNGIITECLPSTRFKVELENGFEISCVLAGKLRMNYIYMQELFLVFYLQYIY